jgi:hypothetical protein
MNDFPLPELDDSYFGDERALLRNMGRDHVGPELPLPSVFAFARAKLRRWLRDDRSVNEPAKPSVSQRELMAAWHYQHARKRYTGKRLMLLNPNEHSDVKVEKYIFSLNPTIFSNGAASLVWGTANGWTAFKNPQVPFRAENIAINVPVPGLAYVENIQAANVSAQIGSVADAFSFGAPHGRDLSLPTLPPQNTMQVQGTWTPHVPPTREPDLRRAERELQEWLEAEKERKKESEESDAPISYRLNTSEGTFTVLAKNAGEALEIARSKPEWSGIEFTSALPGSATRTRPSGRAHFVLAIDFTGWATVIA